MRLTSTPQQTTTRASAPHAVVGCPKPRLPNVRQCVGKRASIICHPYANSQGEAITDADKAKVESLVRKFQMADVDGSGAIDREELRNLLQSTESGETYLLSQDWLPEEELDRIIAKYDKDNSGSITLDEFKELAYDGLLLDGKLSEYEEAFKAADSSGNGTVGAMELAQLFANLGNPMSPERLVDVMQQYDRDESGQIEFSEFLLMCRDNLVELKDLLAYIRTSPTKAEGDVSPSGALLDPAEDAMTIIFSEGELDEVLAKKQPDGLTVIFGGLTWCRPCKAMQRPLQRLAEVYKNVTFLKLFGNANAQTKHLFKNRLQIRSTPCLIVFRGDKVVYTQTGNNKEKFETNLRAVMKPEEIPASPQLYTAYSQ